MDGKIYITISDERGGGGKGVSQSGETVKTPKEKENHLGSYAVHQGMNLVKQSVMKAVNFSVSNIGNFTGDYLTQKNVQAGLSNAMTTIGYGTTALAGFKIGGIWGAVIAVGVKGVSDALSFGLNEKANYQQNRRTNYEIAELRELSGLNSLLDGSRGTLA